MLSRARCAATLMLVSLLGAPLLAAGSPPTEASAEERAAELLDRGTAKFDLADFNAAIELWGQAYELLPPTQRGELEILLANAHTSAYGIDRDPRHLRMAQVLFTKYLAAHELDPEARAAIEGEVAKLDTELEEIAASERAKAELERLAASERAEPEPEVVDQAGRDRLLAEQAELERSQQIRRQARERRSLRRRFAVSGTLTGLGVLSLGAMGVGLALGEGVDRRGVAALADRSTPDDVFDELLWEGNIYNRMAWTTAIIGGILVVSGTVSVVSTLLQRRRVRQGPGRVALTAEGIGLQF